MNANELADALQETEPYYSTDYKLFDQAATMLRQQQAEIEQWGVEFDKLTDDFMKQQAEIEALKLSCPKCGGVTGKLEVLNVPAKTCQHGVDDGACKECYAEAQEK